MTFQDRKAARIAAGQKQNKFRVIATVGYVEDWFQVGRDFNSRREAEQFVNWNTQGFTQAERAYSFAMHAAGRIGAHNPTFTIEVV